MQLPQLIALSTLQKASIAVVALVILLLVVLEMILRVSEKLNLTKEPNEGLGNTENQEEDSRNLESATAKLTEMHDHVNSLHTKKLPINPKA